MSLIWRWLEAVRGMRAPLRRLPRAPILPRPLNVSILHFFKRLNHDSGNPPSRSQGQESARGGHRQRALHRLWLRERLPRAGRRTGGHLPQREGQTLRRAARADAGCADLHAARRLAAGRAGGAVRAHRQGLGAPGYPGALHRLGAQGGPARRTARLHRRGLRTRDGHLLPLLHPHGEAGRAV